jgi:hypothetical protein
LTFHYEEPSARAPQALLLAVNPHWQNESWQWISPRPTAAPSNDNIVSVIQSTFDLAKIRTIDPQTLKDGAQMLPLIYMPINLGGASTGPANEVQME